MKKIFTLLASLMLMIFLVGCGNENSAAPSQNNSAENKIERADSDKILVVYFSVPETDKPDNMNREEENSTVVIDGKVLGNTQYVAQVIQKNTGADIFRIEPTTPYPTNHAELEKIATQEKKDNALPKISAQIQNFDQYKIIFVGYPNWYNDMPRIIYSFFEDYDFSGKTVIPFVTSGSSGFSKSIQTIKTLEPNANIVDDGLSITRDKVQDSENQILNWLKGIGF